MTKLAETAPLFIIYCSREKIQALKQEIKEARLLLKYPIQFGIMYITGESKKVAHLFGANPTKTQIFILQITNGV